MEKDKMIHIKLPEEIRKKVRLHCVEEDITIQSYIMGLIQRDIKKREQKGGDKKKK